MKLNRIEIVNVLGLARAEIDLPTAITLISGNNMSGKSSIRDAISMAVLGQPSRVDKKKDLGELLHDGAKKGRIALSLGDDAAASFTLPKGEHVGLDGALPAAAEQYLPYLLDPARFMAVSADERKRLLFDLTGAKPSMKLIQPMLEQAGIDLALFEEVQPLLRQGFPAVAKAAAENAREAKGAWRAVTGENWGSDKAEGWELDVPAGPAVSAEQIAEAEQAVAKTQRDIENGMAHKGKLDALSEQQNGRDEKLAALREKAALLPEAQDKLARVEKDLEQWQAEVSRLTSALAELNAGAGGMECPCCKASLQLLAGRLLPYEGAKHDAKVASGIATALQQAKEALSAATATKAAVLRERAASEAAQAELAALESTGAVEGLEEQLDKTISAISQLRQNFAHQQAKLMALEEQRGAQVDAAKINAQATAEHQRITAWLKIADEFGADGIPARLLARALDPINQSLELLANLAGWPQVRITEDIEVTSNGRRYALASESEQWRADTLLALAIAQLSHLGLVVLDRFDVLQNSARQELLGMLIKLADLGSLDTAILCGTMKEMPAKLPKHVTGVWVANNIAENAAQ